MEQMQFFFGTGTLHAVNSTTNSTPVEFAGLQEISVSFQHSVKELYGKYQFPLSVAKGNGKIECKAKLANISAQLFNELFFADDIADGKTLVAYEEAGQVPASSTYTITVDESATFVEDLGVKYASTGVKFTKVATVAAAGEYSVAAGVYTFHSGDASANVLIDYSYTDSASGTTLTINNQLTGTTPVFSATLSGTYDGKDFSITFNKCVGSKLGFGTKQEDFTIPEFDFSVMADSTGEIGTISFDT